LLNNDHILLDSFERIYRVINQEAENLKDIKSIHVEMVRQWERDIRAYARILEDISLPARLILEHILELKHKAGQMSVESESVNQGFSMINEVGVEEFSVIKISIGTIELSWRDQEYNYLLYPDKVELRTVDEKAMIRFFFSHNFGRQFIHRFSEVINSSKMLYIHPVLEKYIKDDNEVQI